MDFILNEKSLYGQFGSADELSRFRIALDKEMRTEAYWDLEPMHDCGISY